MKICRICGMSGDDRAFYKVKHIYKFINYGKRIWCRDCQKMYIEMKKEEERKIKLQNLNGSFAVNFE